MQEAGMRKESTECLGNATDNSSTTSSYLEHWVVIDIMSFAIIDCVLSFTVHFSEPAKQAIVLVLSIIPVYVCVCTGNRAVSK